MTAPLIPQAPADVLPRSTATAGPNVTDVLQTLTATPPPVRDRAYWTRVIHNVAKVAPDDPRYQASRLVRDQAIQGLQDLADTAAEKDIKDITPGKLGTAAVAFGHGASLGLAGGGPYLDLGRQANPLTAGIADVAGTAALGGIASPFVAGLSPAVGAGVLGGTLGAARGAIEPIPGFNRAESAAIMGGGGALTGAVLGKFVSKVGPVIGTIVNNMKRLAGIGGVAAADIEGMTEAAIRAQLRKLNVAPDLIERAVQSWKTTGELSIKGMTAPPSEPVTVRPGETITQTSPRGFEVTGQRATPAVPTAPTVAEMLGVTTREVPIAGGQTMPPVNQQEAARNAFNYLQGLGATTPEATTGARQVAGGVANQANWDPRQALLLALLLGQKPNQ